MPPKKLSGSGLLQELGVHSLDRPAAPSAPKTPAPKVSTGAVGRRSKVGSDFIPLTLRVSKDQVAHLQAAAFSLMQARGPGATITPQDVVRMLIDRAIKDPDFPANLTSGSAA